MVEDFLPPPGSTRVDAIIAGYLQAVDSGAAPSREALRSRYPAVASEIEEFLDDQARLAGVARDLEPTAVAVSPLEGARRCGEYEIIAEVARGGMGVVYRATHARLGRTVALKALLGGELASERDRNRFDREMRAVAALEHSNIVPTYDVGEHDGVPFFTMMLLEGGSLAHAKDRYRTDPAGAARLVAKVASAVDFAHRRGILHRDLKPGNILLDARGEPYVSDFGLAKRFDGEHDLTLSGQLLGTARYMAPERVREDEVALTVASDVYSLGAILYELITGHAPFEEKSPLETLRRVMAEEPEKPRAVNARVPPDLEAICLKCLEKDPAGRYQAAKELADDLDRFVRGETVMARRSPSLLRAGRWCRRHPARAVAVALLTCIAVGSSVAAFAFRERVYQARLDEARAQVFKSTAGRKRAGLRAIAEAAAIRPGLEARNAAVALLALTDLDVDRRWDVIPTKARGIVFDAELKRYSQRDADASVVIRRVDDNQEVGRLPLPPDGMHAWPDRFSPDDRLLAVRYRTDEGVGRDAEFWIWDWERGAPMRKIPGRFGIGALAFSRSREEPSRDWISLGDVRGNIVLHDLSTGKEVRRIDAQRDARQTGFSPSGRHLAAAVDNAVKIWDLEDENEVPIELKPHHSYPQFAWHPRRHVIAIVAHDIGSIWDVATASRIKAFRVNTGGTFVAFDHSGDLIATCGWDNYMRLWGLGGRLITRDHGMSYFAPRFSRDDDALACFRSYHTYGTWRVSRSRVFSRRPGRTQYTYGLGIHPDGRVLALATNDGVWLQDLPSGVLLGHIPCGVASSSIFEPSSGDLLICDQTGLHRWPWRPRRVDGRATVTLGPPASVHPSLMGPTRNASLSHDGRYLVVCRYDRAVLVDLEDAEADLRELQLVNLNFAAVSAGGEWTATSPLNGRDVRVWDRSGNEVWRHEAPAWSRVISARVTFSPDGKWLVVGQGQEYAVWRTGGRGAAPDRTYPGREWTGQRPCAFDAQGEILALLTEDRQGVRLIDFENDREFVTLQGPELGQITDFVFGPRRNVFAAVIPGYGCIVWNLRELRGELDRLGLDWDGPGGDGEPELDPIPIELEIQLGRFEHASQGR